MVFSYLIFSKVADKKIDGGSITLKYQYPLNARNEIYFACIFILYVFVVL